MALLNLIGTPLNGLAGPVVEPKLDTPHDTPQHEGAPPPPDHKQADEVARRLQQDDFASRTTSGTGRPVEWFNRGLPTPESSSSPGYGALLEHARQKALESGTPRQVFERSAPPVWQRSEEERAKRFLPPNEQHLAQLTLQRLLEKAPMGQPLPVTARRDVADGSVPLETPTAGAEPLPILPTFAAPTGPATPQHPQQPAPQQPQHPQLTLQQVLAKAAAMGQPPPLASSSELIEPRPATGGEEPARGGSEARSHGNEQPKAKTAFAATPWPPQRAQALAQPAQNPLLAQVAVQRMLQSQPVMVPQRRLPVRSEASERRPSESADDAAGGGETFPLASEQGVARLRMMATLARLNCGV